MVEDNESDRAVGRKAEDYLETARMMGAHAVFTKPLDRDRLLASVAAAAALHGAQRDF